MKTVGAAQLCAGVEVITDGEQCRDSHAKLVVGILDKCQMIPLTDLLPLVDEPEGFARELRALEMPAAEIRHPAVFGPLGRSGTEYQAKKVLSLSAGIYNFALLVSGMPTT